MIIPINSIVKVVYYNLCGLVTPNTVDALFSLISCPKFDMFFPEKVCFCLKHGSPYLVIMLVFENNK